MNLANGGLTSCCRSSCCQPPARSKHERVHEVGSRPGLSFPVKISYEDMDWPALSSNMSVEFRACGKFTSIHFEDGVVTSKSKTSGACWYLGEAPPGLETDSGMIPEPASDRRRISWTWTGLPGVRTSEKRKRHISRSVDALDMTPVRSRLRCNRSNPSDVRDGRVPCARAVVFVCSPLRRAAGNAVRARKHVSAAYEMVHSGRQ